MPILPLSDDNRKNLATQLFLRAGAQDPLSFLENVVFKERPDLVEHIAPYLGAPPADFYRGVIRYCEMSAWLEEPPLIIALLTPFALEPWPQPLIDAIRKEGPFRRHLPKDYPYYVWRVAAELPLLGRQFTRWAGLAFDWETHKGQTGRRVLRVFGPKKSGKTFTLAFFQYLTAVQPEKVGVVYIDLADQEMVMQAAGANIPIELYLARRMEGQVRRRRADLRPLAPQNGGGLPGVGPLLNAVKDVPYPFQQLSDIQQRTRWARELAAEFVDQVLFRLQRVPSWWVVVFDNCEKAPAEAQEFVRQLVARAAGSDPSTAEQADRGVLRVVLLGDSAAMLPNPVYQEHIVEEDLGAQPLGEPEVKEYFTVLGAYWALNLNEAQLQTLADESIARAHELANGQPARPWPQALAEAVLEKTTPLEALAAQKRST